MYQVRWGADYLMKMIGSGTGTNADYLEIIYQVYLMPLLSKTSPQCRNAFLLSISMSEFRFPMSG